MKIHIAILLAAFALTGRSISAETERIPTGEMLPILEDYQPPRLSKGEIWMGLPIARFVQHQGDFITIPVKLAIGPDSHEEVAIKVSLLLKSSQRVKPEDFVILHWLNGYTKNNCNLAILGQKGHLTHHTARLNSGVPLTKFLRFRIPENCPQDVYLLHFEVQNEGAKQYKDGYIHFAVSRAMEFAAFQPRVQGEKVILDVRDREGNPRFPEVVLLYNTKQSVQFLLKPRDADKGLHEATVPAKIQASSGWKLKVLDRNFPTFDQDVTLATK